MEIRDPVHGSIQILDEEIPLIEHPFFQRLRGVKQLGLSEYAFPGASHTRYLHSVGVMSVATKAFEKIFATELATSHHKSEFQRLKFTVRLAGMLHDIGHAPLSHATESVMPNVDKLKLSSRYLNLDKTQNKKRHANHEDYTLKSITDSSFSDSFKLVEKSFGVKKECVADLISGNTVDPDYFTIGKVNYFPVLHQLVSSELDCDRMDYLLRDSYFCGVSYGDFDLDWILDNLRVCTIDSMAYLGISERAIPSFDDFLLSRYHMFLMVYFHYRAVCLEKLLEKYFAQSAHEYKIPHDIEEYRKHDDSYLMNILRNSKSPIASKIINNSIPTKIYETFGDNKLEQLNDLTQFLGENKIDYILCSSTGRLSKYYDHKGNPLNLTNKYSMKVEKNFFGTNNKTYSDMHLTSVLYEKFRTTHTVNRLHCDIETLPKSTINKIYKIIQK